MGIRERKRGYLEWAKKQAGSILAHSDVHREGKLSEIVEALDSDELEQLCEKDNQWGYVDLLDIGG